MTQEFHVRPHGARSMAAPSGDVATSTVGRGLVLVIRGGRVTPHRGHTAETPSFGRAFRVWALWTPALPSPAKNASIDAQADAHAALMDGLGVTGSL